MHKAVRQKLQNKIMAKKHVDKTMHIFCCNEDNVDKMTESIKLFKTVFTDNKFVTITDNHHLNFMLKNMRDRSKYLHYTTKEISYYMYAIAQLSTALLEVITKRPIWKQTVENCIRTNLLELPKGFNLDDVDLETPEQIVRLISGFFIKSVQCIKVLFAKDSKTFPIFCDDTVNICCRLVEKYIGPMLIKTFEECLAKAFILNKPKKYIQELEDEIKTLKSSGKTLTQSLVEVANIFNSNIRILLIYIYAIFVLNIMKIHGPKENYLVAISSVDYSIFIGLLYDEFKKNTDKMNVNVFGDTTQKEIDEQLEFVVKANLALKEEEAEKIRLNLLEEEERENKRKNAIESEKTKMKEKKEKKRLERLEAERLEKERLDKFEAERLEAKRLKQIEAERLEAERLEAERLEAERLKQIEDERLEAERLKQIEDERLKQIEAEKLEDERFKKIEAEKLEAERLKQIEAEKLEAERLKQIEAEKLEAERLEKIKSQTNETYNKETKKLNPEVKEFNPNKSLTVKVESNGVYIEKEKADQLFNELFMFKNNPNFYIKNKNCYLFEMMQTYPQLFKYNELRGLQIAKNIELLLNSMITCSNSNIRDNLYSQLKLTESFFFKIVNE